MNNDLVSREVVKKKIDKFIGYLDEDMIYRIKVAIDKVPTVAVDNYSMGYQDGVSKVLSDKPQGEWLWLGDNPSPNHKWSCNKCGRGVKEQENFCPNCGLKMMKGGAE